MTKSRERRREKERERKNKKAKERKEEREKGRKGGTVAKRRLPLSRHFQASGVLNSQLLATRQLGRASTFWESHNSWQSTERECQCQPTANLSPHADDASNAKSLSAPAKS